MGNHTKKVRLSNPYKDEFTVFVRVRTESLNELSNDKLSKVNMLDNMNKEIMNEMKTRNAIFTSWSSIFDSELNKFLSTILIGLTSL